MKKLIVAILTVILALCTLSGCSNSTGALDNTDGAVTYGNGSFLVEKGDYAYFINGKEVVTAENKFGKVEKASLVRVLKTELSNPKTAKIETVIPKLILSANYASGFFMYGDYVYYATPSTIQDKTGAVLNTHNEFYRFNLKTGKNDSNYICKLENNTKDFKFIEVDGKVYLITTATVTDGEASQNKLVVYDCESKNKIFTSENYVEVAFAEDSSKTVFFTVKGRTVALNNAEQDFDELYRYNVGETSATLELSGAGFSDMSFDDRETTLTEDKLVPVRGSNGVTINLIKNTGKLFVYKVNKNDTDNTGSYYYGTDLVDGEGAIKETLTKINLGASNGYIDQAMQKTSYFKSLNEVYYVESGDAFVSALMKFDYTAQNSLNKLNGRTIISEECEGYTIQFVKGDYMYLANASEGYYYRCNYTATSDVKVNKINAVPMQVSSSWFIPTVVDDRYFIGAYSGNYYLNYIYVVDMQKIDDATLLEGKDVTYYEDYLETYSVENRENILSLWDTRIGVITSSDSKDLNDLLESNYPEEKEEK